MATASTALALCVLWLGLPEVQAESGPSNPATAEIHVDVHAFRVVTQDSGPINYYTIVDQGPLPYIHAAYRPPYETTVLGYQFPDSLRRSIASLRWRWRALVLPRDGNECEDGRGDSAAVVYVTWKRGLRWYSLKYVWSSVGPKGATCDKKRNPFRAKDTVIVESGPPLGHWRSVQMSPDVEFRNHFEDGDPTASVPDLVGVGIMSDGDQTSSPSEADYADFVMVPK